ncbi:hypothetical protein [Persephonella sp.]
MGKKKFFFIKLEDKGFHHRIQQKCIENNWLILIEGPGFFIVEVPEEEEELVKGLEGLKIAGEVNLSNLRIKKIRIKEEN